MSGKRQVHLAMGWVGALSCRLLPTRLRHPHNPMSDASPLATGGAGVDFETEVGASYLAALLTGAPARGAGGGRVVEVRFQQPHSDSPLDDMMVETEGTVARVRLDLQLKQSFAFRPSDKGYAGVIEACWATFQRPEFQSPEARFGVAIGAKVY